MDAGDDESEVIKSLKETYTPNGWHDDRFCQLKHHDFEEYYPPCFQDKVNEIKSMTDKQKRRTAKKELLDEVEQWISDNPDSAKGAFIATAADIIDILKSIEEALK